MNSVLQPLKLWNIPNTLESLSNNLEWGHHVDIITKKASNTLNFLRWNLKHCPQRCKEVTLVRSTVEASAVWDPHTKDTDKLERINRQAARMVMNDYKHCSSVTATMKHLEWPTLEHWREIQRLTMMFKVVRGLVAVPSTQLTPADQRITANHQFKYRNILTNPAPYKFSFFPHTIPSWNKLPAEMVNASTLDPFKSHLS